VIAPGVTIGKFSVVASNSYVDADVPDYSIYGGNPARFIRAIDPKEVLIEKIGE
jgi:acetyltransferase-like isoleucine patch superfamily enzyme